MKRGIYGLILLLLVLLIPIVFANPVSDLLLGTSKDSIIFQKIIYSTAIFIILFSTIKKTIFKEENEAKFAKIISLIFALFSFRLTPDSFIEGFAWFIMILGPFFLLYKLAGVFIKQEEGKFSWGKFIFAAIGTLIAFFAFGTSTKLGVGGYNTGLGFVDELFADINYLTFSKGGIVLIFFLLALAGFALFSLISKLRGGAATNGAEGDLGDLWKYFLITLGLILLIALISSLAGGGFGAIPNLFGTIWTALAGLGWWWLLILLLILLILGLAFPQTRKLIFSLFKGIWNIIKWIFGLLGGIGRAVRGIGGGLGGRNVFIELQTPDPVLRTVVRVPWDAAGAARSIAVAPSSTTPLMFTVYRGRFFWSSSRLEAAQLTFVVNNGGLVPTNGPTNANGQFRTDYTAPGVAGNTNLQIRITHPNIDPLTVIPPYIINIGALQDLNVTVPAIAPILDGQTAQIIVEVRDAAGDGVDGANVLINFPGNPTIVPFRGTTIGGGPGTSSRYIVTTPALRRPAAAPFSYNFEVRVNAPGYLAPIPPVAFGAITVDNPTITPLTIGALTVRDERTNAIIAPVGSAPRRINVSQTVNIEFNLVAGAAPVPGATITVTPSPANLRNPVSLGAGRYRGSFNPAATDAGILFQFLIQATAGPRYNDASETLELEVADIPQINIGFAPPGIPATARINADTPFRVLVTTGTPAVNLVADVIIRLTSPGAYGTTEIGRGRSTGGFFDAIFHPVNPGPHTISIEVSQPRYRTNTLTTTVRALPQDRATITIETTNTTTGVLVNPVAGVRRINIGQTLDINVIAIDSASNPVNVGTVQFTPRTNLTNFNGNFAATPGTHTASFVTAAAGTYTYTIRFNIPGFLPVPDQPLIIEVINPSVILVNVDWVPDPTTSNRRMLMNFLVLDSVSGMALNGASITITDAHTTPVRFSQPIPLTTNNTGRLIRTLEIELGRVLARGTTERHTLNIEVTHPTYAAPKNGSIDVTFHPPRSRLGGPRTLTF